MTIAISFQAKTVVVNVVQTIVLLTVPTKHILNRLKTSFVSFFFEGRSMFLFTTLGFVSCSMPTFASVSKMSRARRHLASFF